MLRNIRMIVLILLAISVTNSYAISYVKYVVNFYKGGAVRLTCGDTSPIQSIYNELQKKLPDLANLKTVDVSNSNGWSAALNLGVSCRTPGSGYLAVDSVNSGKVLGYIYDTGIHNTQSANAGDIYAGTSYKFEALSDNQNVNNIDHENVNGTGVWYSIAILPNGEVKLIQNSGYLSLTQIMSGATSMAYKIIKAGASG